MISTDTKQSSNSYRMFKLIMLLLIWIPAGSQNFYKTPSGKKYHVATCRMVNNVSAIVTLAEAAEAGLGPCKICHPQPVSPQVVKSKAKGQQVTVQCKGITKNGNRCRHKTSIANGYCFQHNPDK